MAVHPRGTGGRYGWTVAGRAQRASPATEHTLGQVLSELGSCWSAGKEDGMTSFMF